MYRLHDQLAEVEKSAVPAGQGKMVYDNVTMGDEDPGVVFGRVKNIEEEVRR